jgi:Icc-related predicted phosphoesterase
MKFCAISDMHGQLDFVIDKCEVLLICGDIVPLHTQRNIDVSFDWLKTIFVPWCEEQPCDKVIIVGGNHDFALEAHEESFVEFLKDHPKIIYLDNNDYTYKGFVIYGTPYCHPFGPWAFMNDMEEQKALYDCYMEKVKGKKKIDIIMAHDSTYGTSDILLQKDTWRKYTREHIGNKELRNLVLNMQPSIFLHGHLHSTNHKMEKLGETKCYCVSLLDEEYYMAYKPFYFELADKK